MKKKLVRLLKQILGLIPSAIPTGVSEFNSWAQDIIDTYDLPTTDIDSIKFTLSTIVMHLGPQVATKPKFYFVLTLRAGAAKQVAGYIFQEIKLKQAESAAKKAAEEAENEQQAIT